MYLSIFMSSLEVWLLPAVKYNPNDLKAYSRSNWFFLFMLKVANFELFNYNEFTWKAYFLVIYSSYQCPANFGKSTDLKLGVLKAILRHSNSFH
jgi:hypothetical protein